MSIYLRLPFMEGEILDWARNRELLLSVLNQEFYRKIIRDSREVLAPEKDILFREEFSNKIKVFGRELEGLKDYYQAFDDTGVTQKINQLKKEGTIKINIKDSYPNGNIRYFSCPLGERTIKQLADELTITEARRVFPEDFYYERAYYQVKIEHQEEFLEWSQTHKNLMHTCSCNSNNFYENGGVRYFWVDYYGNQNDFERRQCALELAEEVPKEKAKQLQREDKLAIYKEGLTQREQQMGTISPEIRQKRLHTDKRTRELSVEQMIEEVNRLINNHKGKKRKDICYGKKPLTLDDVILLLIDVKLTEEDAQCVATVWTLLKRIDEQDIADDSITPDQVIELFPELWDQSEVSYKAARIIAKRFNDWIIKQKERIQKAHADKQDNLVDVLDSRDI